MKPDGSYESLDGSAQLLVALEQGDRITSLRTDGREWLLPDLSLPASHYPVTFIRPGFGGWDECIPTVAACVHNGAELADHGDAWQLPWTPTSPSSARVDLASVPLRFSRTIHSTQSGFRFAYSVSNLTSEPQEFLWSAHPQFKGRDITVDFGPAALNWSDEAGNPEEWNPTEPFRETEQGTGRKLYLDSPSLVSRATLRHASSGSNLELAWSVPELGIWIDHCAFAREPVIAVEPCTSRGDALTTAQHPVVLGPSQTLSWDLSVTNLRD